LKRHGLKVEIRVVIHKQTYERLPQLARFIVRNLTFVDQVVWMGLEMTGFTRANIDALWIDPIGSLRGLRYAQRRYGMTIIGVMASGEEEFARTFVSLATGSLNRRWRWIDGTGR